MKPVDISDGASADFVEITGRVLEFGVRAGGGFVDGVQDALRQLRAFPGSGHRHVSLPDPYRVLNVGDWLIVHEELDERVVIHRILHAASDLRSFRP